MEFKRLFLRNFMSVGEPGIELNFQQLSGIVLLQGVNRDVGANSSNGSGKSLLIEGVLWILYGKTLRGLTTNEVINNVNEKRCLGVLEWDKWKIERSRKPNKLKLFEDPTGEFGKDTEISQAKMGDTQALIEEKIGVDFMTFCNIFCFGQHNLFSFVSSDEKTRRQIVEDLLSLSDYNFCLESARSSHRELKSSLKETLARFETISEELAGYMTSKRTREKEKSTWATKLESEISLCENRLDSLSKVDHKAIFEGWENYDRAQAEAPKVRAEIGRISGEYRERKRRATDGMGEAKTIDGEIQKIENLEEGVKCSHCFSTIDPKNASSYLKELQEKRGTILGAAEREMMRAQPLKAAEKQAKSLLEELLAVQMPKIEKDFLIRLEAEKQKTQAILDEKQKQIKGDPYSPILKDLEDKIRETKDKSEDLRISVKGKESLLPYLNFWVEAFGPEGIRSFIVENVMDFLNGQINYWLQFLIDNKIIVAFDKYLNVNITRDTGEPIDYKQGSGGEKRRIDLAISLAFADLMRISNNTNNNILFLDEVVDSLDFSGVNGVFTLISELSKNKIVFVITHNPTLLNLLDLCPRVKMVKEGGFSTIENGNTPEEK